MTRVRSQQDHPHTGNEGWLRTILFDLLAKGVRFVDGCVLNLLCRGMNPLHPRWWMWVAWSCSTHDVYKRIVDEHTLRKHRRSNRLSLLTREPDQMEC
jgi:hypothetical protein